jgi:Relaxase/Mobilisation nuclease domain
MIGQVTTSASFASSLGYVMRVKPEDLKLSKKELEEKFPEVAPTRDDPGWEAGARHRIIYGNMSGATEQELKTEFPAIRSLRWDIKNPVMSIVVRKAPGDYVRLQDWEQIGEKVLDSLGLKGCPFVVIQHRDKDDHIHIIASRIRLDGKVISDSKSYEKVERVMRQVEVEYGFERVQGSYEAYDRAPTWWEHKLAHERGKLSPKMEMQARISAALEDKPTTTQFINRLHEAHGIETIFKVNEDRVPCGIAFRYGEVTMSGGALGRGYTWNKLRERGLTYDERDVEAVERASQRAGQSRQSVTGRKRAVDQTTRTIGDAGRGAVNDSPSRGAVREKTVDYGGREAQGQQHAARPSVARGDRQPDQAGLPEAEANYAGSGGEAATVSYEPSADEPVLEALSTPQSSPFLINTNPNVPGHMDAGLRLGPTGMEQSAAVAGGNQGIEMAGAIRINSAMDLCGGDLIHAAGANGLDNLPTPDSTSLTSGFRDGLREAICDVDDYMRDYCHEGAQYQSAVMINSVELAETGVEAEVEVEEIIEEVIML